MCDSCVEKGVFSKKSCVEIMFLLLGNELTWIELAILCISMDSEARNQTTQDIFKENKLLGQTDSQLTYCDTFPDAVRVGKRKRQSFANWFPFVDQERTKLVLLRALWNDTLGLNSVRNRNRQDVKSFAEVGSPEIRPILTKSVKKIIFTLVPDKFRQTKDNVKGLFAYHFSVCWGNFSLTRFNLSASCEGKCLN